MTENNVSRGTINTTTTTPRYKYYEKWAQDRDKAEEVATWLAEAHAYQSFEFESDHTVEECQAWLTAYDHSVEQWVYDMPNPLEVWEEVYSDHTHDHTHDDHTRTYAWARAYAHAYRRETHALMSALVDASASTHAHEHMHAHEGDNNGVTGGDDPQPTHRRDTTDVTNV